MSILAKPASLRPRWLLRGPLRLTVLACGFAAAACSVGMAVALVVRAPDIDLAIRLYAASIAALVLIILVRLLSLWSRPSPAPGFIELVTTPQRDDDGIPNTLTMIEQSLRFSTTALGDFHSRMRPILSEIAASRLVERGLRLNQPLHQEQIEAILGPVAYDLLRYDRPPPTDRFAAGILREELEVVIDALEALG